MTLFIISGILFVAAIILMFLSLKAKGHNVVVSLGILIFWGVYLLSVPLFGLVAFGADYHEAIDPISGGYSAFNNNHILTLFVFLALFFVSLFLLRKKGNHLPPLIRIICMVFLIIGIGISITVVMHGSGEFKEQDGFYRDGLYPIIFPILNILLAFWGLLKSVEQEASQAPLRQYRNKILNAMNRSLVDGSRQPLWIVLLLLPVFAVVTLLLILFGQEPDSMIKAFTETTTWNFSQHTHPPYLGHTGHYLCTVAACGHPQVVKPLRLGERHGREIIVNRQLMIANAYEEMIQDYFPRFHKIIRYLYDKYGYPLSKHITTSFRSDIVYIMMKPAEWFFLTSLYLCCRHPETKIRKQYPLKQS